MYVCIYVCKKIYIYIKKGANVQLIFIYTIAVSQTDCFINKICFEEEKGKDLNLT